MGPKRTSQPAALRFGREVADRVATLLEGIENPDRLAAAGDVIVSAETGTELTEPPGQGWLTGLVVSGREDGTC